jgi:thiamine-monophosphate kinase
VLQGKLEVAAPARAQLIGRYRLPRPRLALGEALRGLAHAAIDISDGLLADLGHIVETSKLGAEIRVDLLPLSAADLPGAQDAALSGGDDYELLFTTAPSQRDAIGGLAEKLDLPITRIGQMRTAPGIRVLDAAGAEVHPDRTGWQHF